jgi:hypothetical protein
MALLMVIYTICASRINLPFFIIFLSLIIVFSLLAAAYWKLGAGDEVMGNRLSVVSPHPPNLHEKNLTLHASGRWRCLICGYYNGMVAVDCSTA